MKKQSNWIKEFNKKFKKREPQSSGKYVEVYDVTKLTREIKTFIAEQIKKAYEAGQKEEQHKMYTINTKNFKPLKPKG